MTNSLEVPTPDLAAATANADRRSVGLPPGALGDLAVVVDALAALHGSGRPAGPRRPHLTAFAADHGVTANRITSVDPGETAGRAADLAAGRGPLGVLAGRSGVTVAVLDVGTDDDNDDDHDDEPDTDDEPNTGVLDVRVTHSCPPIDRQDALTMSEVATAIQTGRDEADRRIDAGADLLIGTLCGVGADIGATAIATVLTGIEPVDAAGRDGGLDDDGWSRRVATIRDARYRLTTGNRDAATLLRVAGGADLAALTGFVLQSALRGVPVVVDDVPGAVAAVLAHRFAPGAEHYVLVPSVLAATVHRRLLDLLNLQPLLAISLGEGPGLASLLAVSLVQAATSVVDAAPEDRDDLAPWTVQEWAADLL